MKNRKNNKITLFTLFVIIITIIALIATSGTYAKYTSSVSATATAKVAKWDVTANDISMTNPEASNNFTFDIFDTILDSDLTNEETNVNQPIAENSTKVIAPGTSGHKDLTIVNNSDVDIKISMNFTKSEDSPDVPIKFALVNSDADVPDISDFRTASEFSTYLAGEPTSVDTEISYGESDNEKTYTLYWIWPYSVDATADGVDNNLGIQAATGNLNPYVVSITVTATQVD